MENEGMQHGLRANHCAFWKNHLPSLTKIARDMELAAGMSSAIYIPRA
jgi:hypothetical protein